MTKAEAIKRIQEHMIIHEKKEPRAIYITKALQMAINALEQEDVLDKIKDEINSPNRGTCDYFIVDRIEEIIDKHKAESEE